MTAPDQRPHALVPPAPVAAYVAAMNADDPIGLLAALSDDAVVVDHGDRFTGDALATWASEEATGHRLVTEVHDVVTDGPDTVVVRTRVSGDFPGGQADFSHRVTFRGDRVAVLEIAFLGLTRDLEG